MKTHARVVVVGGGVVGVSTLYHLVKKGWSDVVLLERTELTAGSTWHAAGLLPLFNMSYTVGQLHKYSVDLYKRLEAETGQDVSFHVTGNLRLACNRDRMDEYYKYSAVADTIGVHYEFLTPKQVKELWPLCTTDDLLGAIYHPEDGHIAPVDLTNALAKGARTGGAEVNRNTQVTAIEPTASGEWVVRTNKGDITCEHVVCATGNYVHETGRMLGLRMPAMAVQHQYIVTDEVPELRAYREAGNKELAVLRESDAQYYLREERNGWILGPYEKGAPAVFGDGVPDWFGQDLFEGDLDRLMPHVEAAIARVPSFESAGIKEIINGPICYSPDGNPLIGPAWGLRNVWLNEAHSFGVTAAGGAGWQLAEWMVEGEPTIDMSGTDARRYGAYAGKRYTRRKNEEAYEFVFLTHYPDEERHACRPAKTSPVFDKLSRLGAVWGQRYGWERPNWFAPVGVDGEDVWSFRRSNYFEHVGNEVRLMRERVGIIDMTPFAKHEISGPGAEAWMDGLVANKVPTTIGRSALCHALTRRGTVRSEFTITKLGDDFYYVVSAGAGERYDDDFLRKHLPGDGSVEMHNTTTSRGTYVLAGPRSREVLAKLTDSPLDSEHFPWLSGQVIEVGLATDVYALRLNYVGELGWELHFPIEYAHHIFDSLMEAGQEFGIGPVGMRAMESMRMETSYRGWGNDLNQENTLLESGMGRFVRFKKEFVGKVALEQQKAAGVPLTFVTLEVLDVADADSLGNEAIYAPGGELVGRATSGYYGHFVQKSLALAYVKPEHAEPGTELETVILGERKRVVVIPESPHDPENERLRA